METTASIEAMNESARWHGRDVWYWSGQWERLKSLIPTFELAGFKARPDLPANPNMRAVIRRPQTQAEHPMPVGVVSNTYSLVQHAEVAEKCFEGIRQAASLDPLTLRCEIGLTSLGEWMNLRIYLPEAYAHITNVDDVTDLRLECFNSVDGSSRLVVLFGWLRLVCSNGMVIGETLAELRDIHNQHLTLAPIPKIIEAGLVKATKDSTRLGAWAASTVTVGQVEPWVNTAVTREWGKKAACRVFHICGTGQDVEIQDPFAPGVASEKPVRQVAVVPGSTIPVKTLLDVSQALSWVATRRGSPEERILWQRQIPELIGRLSRMSGRAQQGVMPLS